MPKWQKTRFVHRFRRWRLATGVRDLAFSRREDAVRPLRAEKPMHKTRSVPLRAGLAEPPPAGTRDSANIGSRQSWFNGEGRGLARGAAPSRCDRLLVLRVGAPV